MALKIFWTKRALNNYNNILTYLENEFGEKATRAFAIKIQNFLAICSKLLMTLFQKPHKWPSLLKEKE